MITFLESNVIPIVMTHSNALVIKIIVANTEVRQVYVDNGGVVSILYLDYFKRL